jgi:fibronectin-binding autotransporter adhesin
MLAGLLGLALTASSVNAQSTWTGTSSNLWTDVGNWDNMTVPGTGGTALFSGASANTSISLNGASQPINTISFTSSPTSYNLGVTAGDTFAVDAGGTISIASGVTTSQTISAAISAAGSMTVSNAATATTLTLGAAGGSTAFSLPAGSTLTLTTGAAGATIVNNDSVQGASLTVSGSGTTTFNGTVQLNGGTLVPSSTGKTTFNGIISGTSPLTGTNYAGTLALNAQNTYTGGTTFTGTLTPAPTILIGASSIGNPGSVTSGPFGTAAVTFSNANAPAILVPVGADRTVANAFTLTNGFFAGTATAAQDSTGPHNLHLTGAMTINKVITNNMAPGVALIFDGPNNVQVNGGTFQSNAAGTGSVTIFNENVTNTTGALTVQNAATVILNGSYAPTGAITVKNNTATGVGATGGTLIVNGTTSTGAINVNATNSVGLGHGGTLGGIGTIGGTVTVSSTVATNQGGIIYPGPGGTTPGTLNGASMVWDPLGRYSYVYNPSDPTTGNSLIHGTGTLDIHNLSSSALFDLNFVPNGSGTPTLTPYTLATFNGGITGAGGTSGAQFANGADITTLFTMSGTPPTPPSGATAYAVTVAGNAGGPQSIQLTPVPEPAAALAVCGAAFGGFSWWRRRMAAAK